MGFLSHSHQKKKKNPSQNPQQQRWIFYFVFLGSGVLDTLLMGLVLGDGDCLLWGEAEAPLRGGGGGLAEV